MWTIEKLERRPRCDALGRPTKHKCQAWRVIHFVDGKVEDAFEVLGKRRAKKFKDWLCHRHGYVNGPCRKVVW